MAKQCQEMVFPILLVLICHMIFIRNFAFLQTDSLAAVWIAVTVLIALSRLRTPKRWQIPLATVICFLGLGVKLSYLPALAYLPLAEMLRTRQFWQGIKTGLITAVLPLTVYAALLFLFGTSESFGVELKYATVDRYPLAILENTLHALGFLLPLLIVAKHRTRSDEVILLWACSGIYIFSLWIHAPAWDRYYMAVLPMLALLTYDGLRLVVEHFGQTMMWIYIGLFAIVNYSAFYFRVVH